MSSDRMGDRLSRWKIMETMERMNDFSDYQHQRPLLYEDVAHESNKNKKTTRAIMYYHAKRGRLEIIKIPRPAAVFGDFLSGVGHAIIRKDGTVAKQKGRRRSGFILSKEMIDVLLKSMYTDGNGEIRIKIPVTTMTQAEVLTVIKRMRKRGKVHA